MPSDLLVLDLVLFLVKVSRTEKVVDRLVVLVRGKRIEQRQSRSMRCSRIRKQRRNRWESSRLKKREGVTYDLEELALHLVLPSLLPELLRRLEDLGDRSRDHTHRLWCRTALHRKGLPGSGLTCS
jgi:hypothetical protein